MFCINFFPQFPIVIPSPTIDKIACQINNKDLALPGQRSDHGMTWPYERCI